MEIRTIWEWSGDDSEMPWLVASVDEYTIEEHGCIPDFYSKELTDGRRELVLIVPEKAVRDIFRAPKVVAVPMNDAPRAKAGDE